MTFVVVIVPSRSENYPQLDVILSLLRANIFHAGTLMHRRTISGTVMHLHVGASICDRNDTWPFMIIVEEEYWAIVDREIQNFTSGPYSSSLVSMGQMKRTQ